MTFDLADRCVADPFEGSLVPHCWCWTPSDRWSGTHATVHQITQINSFCSKSLLK